MVRCPAVDSGADAERSRCRVGEHIERGQAPSGFFDPDRDAEALGHAYQISDDIIDMQQDAAILGVTNQNDTARAAETLARRVAESKRILTDNFAPTEARTRLIQLVDYVAERKH